jgi:outer membrane protein assembly factor BamB
MELCEGSCRDLEVDGLHCGSCGNACGVSEACKAGSCQPLCGNGALDPGEECDGAAPLQCPAGYKPGATTCTAGCKVDLSPCVLATCGNNQVDPGEECDGPINTNCGSFGPGLFGNETPLCLANCKADISMCVYCGNGKLDVNEACEGGELQGATCSSLGAGSGELGCSQCQLDLSGCSGGLCGDLLGLDDKALWPAEGGCMKRPHGSRFEGPVLAEGAVVPSAPLTNTGAGLSLLVTDDGRTLLTSSQELLVWDGQNTSIGFSSTATTSVAPVLLPGGALLRLGDAGALLLERSGASTWQQKASLELPGGAPTTGAVVRGATVYVGRADGNVWKLSLTTGNAQIFHISPGGVRGTMALDAERKLLYVPEDCSQTSPNGFCQLRAVDLDTGALQWTSFLGFASTSPCHAAVGAGGWVYTSCGASAMFRNPSDPEVFNNGFSTSNDTMILPPAIGKDGKVFLVSSRGSEAGSLFAMTPQMTFLWPSPVDLGARALAAPLLDDKGNIHVCTDRYVASHAPSGELRWKYEWQEPTTVTRCAMALGGPARLDVVTSGRVYRIE